ncbi:MAG: hypothetical protein LIP06_10875 [Tannerellaceae bacterium]|nr:hypothetical protein [Tannerellaceae bacterium]
MKILLQQVLAEQERLDWEAGNLKQAEAERNRQDLEEELRELETMSEAEACAFYRTDTKAEARQGIIEFRTWIA